MTMRERLARTIQTKLHPPLAGKPAQAWYLEVADAALAEIREPTSEMIVEGKAAFSFRHSPHVALANVYQAMIDAAIKDATDGE